jgi:hypothetical protein
MYWLNLLVTYVTNNPFDGAVLHLPVLVGVPDQSGA